MIAVTLLAPKVTLSLRSTFTVGRLGYSSSTSRSSIREYNGMKRFPLCENGSNLEGLFIVNVNEECAASALAIRLYMGNSRTKALTPVFNDMMTLERWY